MTDLAPAPCACTSSAARRGTLDGMSEHPAPADQYASGTPWPDPAAPSGPTTWGEPVHDATSLANGGSVAEPAALPPAVEPVTERVGWVGNPGLPDAA